MPAAFRDLKTPAVRLGGPAELRLNAESFWIGFENSPLGSTQKPPWHGNDVAKVFWERR
jgi:hypothetical protein